MSRDSNLLLLLICGAVTVLMIWAIKRAHTISVERPPEPIRAFFGMRTAKVPNCKVNLEQIRISKQLWADNSVEQSA